MMIDADLVAVSPTSVYRVLKAAGLLARWNGPPFIARDFKEFIAISGMTHVKTSPYYPQRLHSAIHYITPADKRAGRAEAILAARDAKLAAARESRKGRREQKRISA